MGWELLDTVFRISRGFVCFQGRIVRSEFVNLLLGDRCWRSQKFANTECLVRLQRVIVKHEIHWEGTQELLWSFCVLSLVRMERPFVIWLIDNINPDIRAAVIVSWLEKQYHLWAIHLMILFLYCVTHCLRGRWYMSQTVCYAIQCRDRISVCLASLDSKSEASIHLNLFPHGTSHILQNAVVGCADLWYQRKCRNEGKSIVLNLS